MQIAPTTTVTVLHQLYHTLSYKSHRVGQNLQAMVYARHRAGMPGTEGALGTDHLRIKLARSPVGDDVQ